MALTEIVSPDVPVDTDDPSDAEPVVSEKTVDKVFLLSTNEVIRYFSDYTAGIACVSNVLSRYKADYGWPDIAVDKDSDACPDSEGAGRDTDVPRAPHQFAVLSSAGPRRQGDARRDEMHSAAGGAREAARRGDHRPDPGCFWL